MKKNNQTTWRHLITGFAALLLLGCAIHEKQPQTPISFSGVYPHQAYNNNEGKSTHY